MVYKIFSGETTIIICNKNKIIPGESEKTFTPVNKNDIPAIAEFIKNRPPQKTIYILCDDTKTMFRHFKEQFNYIRAAGGIVRNRDGKTLFICKNDTWDLPKGKIDKNEKKTSAAVREVSEECGIRRLSILKPYGTTMHIGRLNDDVFLKETFWYEMHCDDPENIRPQAEERISDIRWFDLSGNKRFLKRTYNSLLELLKNEI